MSSVDNETPTGYWLELIVLLAVPFVIFGASGLSLLLNGATP